MQKESTHASIARKSACACMRMHARLLEVEVEPAEAPRHQQLPLLGALRQPEEGDAVEQVVPRAAQRRAAQRLRPVDGADGVAERRARDKAREGAAAAEAAAVRGGEVERRVVGGGRLAPRACVRRRPAVVGGGRWAETNAAADIVANRPSVGKCKAQTWRRI